MNAGAPLPAGVTDGSSAGRARRRIMIYCPEALVQPHFVFLQFVGRILRDFGHEVFLSYCDRLFPRCVAKESLIMPPGAPREFGEQVCGACVGSFHQLVQAADIPSFAIREAVQPEVIEQIRVMIAGVPDATLRNFAYDGINFGQLCFADLMVVRKLMIDTPLEPEHYTYLREYLVTTLASYIGMVQFLPAAGFTDVLIYGEYAGNVCVAYAADRVGASWKLLHTIGHTGFDRRRFFVARSELDAWQSVIHDHWPQWRDTPLRDDEIVEVGDDVLWRLGSRSVGIYSPAKTQDVDVFGELGLTRDRPVILACTSSLDECNSFIVRGATRGLSPLRDVEQPFSSQTEWLTFLVEEVAKHGDWQLVIRIHPREDANKRERVRAHHLGLLRRQLSNLPANVKVVWPADRISSYDLLEISSVLLVWMTTLGMEAGRLGVPVLRADRSFPNYPLDEFAFSAPDRAGFLRLMGEAMTWKPNFDCLIHAWRFYAYSRFFCSFDARDAAPDIEMNQLPPYRRPKRADQIVEAILGNTTAWEATRAKADFWDGRATDAEAQSIKAQIRRLFHTLMTGREPGGEVTLALEQANAPLPAQPADGAVAIADNQCSYASGGRVYSRFSPMCTRLAILGTA
jgi:hypothetical protein